MCEKHLMIIFNTLLRLTHCHYLVHLFLIDKNERLLLENGIFS